MKCGVWVFKCLVYGCLSGVRVFSDGMYGFGWCMDVLWCTGVVVSGTGAVSVCVTSPTSTFSGTKRIKYL